MAENKLLFEKVASINRPPIFCGVNYQFWKVRMRIFIESFDRGVWDAILSGLFIPKVVIVGQCANKQWSDWIGNKSKKAQYVCIAKNIITSSLNMDKFFKASQCASTKEMWDTLEVMHEGTSYVKQARKYALIQEYELFK